MFSVLQRKTQPVGCIFGTDEKPHSYHFAFFVLFSCDNSLDINADYDVENVVYGLLDKDLDTQWVRLHRTYLGEDGLLAGAVHSDSLYFDTAAIYLAQLNASGDVVNTYEFYRKDTNALEPGVFTTDNYRLYWTDAPIDKSFEYRIRGFIPGNNNKPLHRLLEMLVLPNQEASKIHSASVTRNSNGMLPRMRAYIRAICILNTKKHLVQTRKTV